MIAVIAPKRVTPQCASVRRQSSEAMQHVCRSAQLSVRASSKLFTAVFQRASALIVPALIFPEAIGFLSFQPRRQRFLDKETPASVSLQPNDGPPRAIGARGFDSHQWRHYS